MEGVEQMICLYPNKDSCNQVKAFQAVLDKEHITYATIFFANKLGIGIKEKDSNEVMRLAAVNHFDFESGFESMTYRNLTKVRAQ